MICELWVDEKNGGTLTFSTVENIKYFIKNGLAGDSPKKIWTVEAETWTEAMTKYHIHMGWEPYVSPLEE